MSEPAPSGHVGDQALSPSIRNIPNALTILRLFLVPVFIWLLVRDGGDDTVSRAWAAVVFVVAGITDLVDGELARRQGLVTSFGKILDPIADKALTGGAFVALSWLGELPWWVTVVMLVREVGVTVLRFWVIRWGVIAASPGGKAKTAAQLLAILLYLLPLSGALVTVRSAVLVVAVVLTILTGVDYLARAWRLRAQARR
ncbi:unannotated protein [freshwater metagenome]|uniref:Unannotated protein n=1 Tax=freshwater metagenome TaxID=449393 RepID=A0A6J7BQB5_9ZZZZ|nr:CDP-diacylglycerol--glycerol-3-phosphate 3-phosphatidyltransferase [Actinomycetota bacterium]MSW37395.1 CDP-diacylglycerol--glycerol-3-phosphate 3-phosphatidyltransferase [Actinomycetota bacterium]MSX37925.1 CDP-diacylglycerol--glycerol-3-phosphate 3-phosphatidyltransferase [Actinomycetota bacterium]